MKTICAFTVAAAILCGLDRASAVSLADFGHGTMLTNGRLTLGSRPLLIIRADFQGNDSSTHTATYCDSMVFSETAFPCVNGFLRENSGGRFRYTRAGTGMVDMINSTVNFTEAERADFAEIVKVGGHCINAAARAGFNFADRDANNDGVITQDELAVLIVANNATNDSGATRWANPDGTGNGFTIQNSTKQFRSSVVHVTQNVSFATLTHELMHLSGMLDLYGVWSQECMSEFLTLASCTISSADNPAICHLDPWHKMRLGWCEPRIRDMQQGGVEVLPANQGNQFDKQIILYDSARGTDEYFILEYRTRNSGGSTGYDRDVNDSGLVIWHVKQDNAHNAVAVSSPYVTGGMHAAVWAETPDDLKRGGGMGGPAANAGAWDSGATTPKLKWIGGGLSPAHIFVRPYVANATFITIEICSSAEIWADFNFVSSPPFIPELGNFVFPYNSLAEAVNAAPWGGAINFKAGHTSESATITRPLQLKAWNGPVVLGN